MSFSSNLPTDFRRFCFSYFIIKDITFIVRKGLLNNFCLKEKLPLEFSYECAATP